MSDFKERLSELIQCAHDNEAAFLERFCAYKASHTISGLSLGESCGECMVITMAGPVLVTFSTGDFIQWAESILKVEPGPFGLDWPEPPALNKIEE